MALMRPLDPAFPIERQLAIDASPVVLVNVFTLDKNDEQAFLQAWNDHAAFMKRQPGLISTQLHRAVGESPTYLNYAVWESTADYKAAFTHPEFRAGILGLSVFSGHFPASLPKNRGAQHLRRIEVSSQESGPFDGLPALGTGRDALRFLRAWASAPLATGAQLPSGRQLARAMALRSTPRFPASWSSWGPVPVQSPAH